MIRGWKNIAKVLDVRTVKTARKLVKKYKIPVILLNGRVCIVRSVFERYMLILTEETYSREK
jgi:hypothetical protein